MLVFAQTVTYSTGKSQYTYKQQAEPVAVENKNHDRLPTFLF